jgi:hypothetical protein
LGSTKEQAVKRRYTPPPNVISITETFLFERLPEEQLEPRDWRGSKREKFYACLRAFYEAPTEPDRTAAWWALLDQLDEPGAEPTFGNLLRDEEAWQLLTELNQRWSPEESFIDFFWAVRFLHLPVWTALLARDRMPAARVYHSVSTGYGGDGRAPPEGALPDHGAWHLYERADSRDQSGDVDS